VWVLVINDHQLYLESVPREEAVRLQNVGGDTHKSELRSQYSCSQRWLVDISALAGLKCPQDKLFMFHS
jgi:hypothetical protein